MTNKKNGSFKLFSGLGLILVPDAKTREAARSRSKCRNKISLYLLCRPLRAVGEMRWLSLQPHLARMPRRSPNHPVRLPVRHIHFLQIR